MYLEAEAFGMLILGFAAVILASLAVIISQWVRLKSKAYCWFFAQLVLLIVAFFKFLRLIMGNPSIPRVMLSEENSLALGITGVLWALSMACMLIGITKLSKEKMKGEEAVDKAKEEYYPSFKKVLGMLVFYALLCPLILSVIMVEASKIIGFSEKDPLATALITVIQLVLLVLWLKRKYIINFKSMFSKEKTSAILLIPMAFSIAGLGILLSEAANFTTRIIPMNDFWLKIFDSLSGQDFSVWKPILLIAVVAPIVEEIIFRGMILRGFLKHYSVRKSIILSALLFAIIHMNPWQFVTAFAAGILLGWWYVKTDSILTTIFGHALNNSMSFIIGAVGLVIPGYNIEAIHQPVWFDFLGVVLLVVGVMWLIKLFNVRKINVENNSEGI
jgi:uncharacterized protein